MSLTTNLPSSESVLNELIKTFSPSLLFVQTVFSSLFLLYLSIELAEFTIFFEDL